MAEYRFIQSPKQMSEHNPCGHWHRKVSIPAGFDSGEFPSNCWSFAVDVDGFDVALYALGIKYPYDLVSLHYHIGTRQWSTKPVWHKVGYYTAQWRAGAAVHGDFESLMFSGAESVSEDETNPVLMYHRMQIITTVHATGEIYTADVQYAPEFPLQDCAGKIAVYRDTAADIAHVLILLRHALGIELYWSHQAGKVFFFGEQWPLDANCRDMCIASDKANGYFYVAILTEAGGLNTYRTTDGGITWIICAAMSAPLDAQKLRMWVDGGTIFIWCHNTLYFSNNEAFSFNFRIKEPVTEFAIADASTNDAVVFYPDKLEKTLDYIFGIPLWTELPVIPEIDYKLTQFTTIKSSGPFVVYTTDNTFVNDRIVIPISQNLGSTWELVQSPLSYFDSTAAAFTGTDDPRWKFSPQGDKIPLDPQYT